jgi:hypothetical protein
VSDPDEYRAPPQESTLTHHRVAVAFDVLASSPQEAAVIVRDTLNVITDSADHPDAAPNAPVPTATGWDAGPDAALPGGAFELPADLSAWQALRELVHSAPGTTLALTTATRTALAGMLDAADLDVVVPDAKHPEEPPVYEGPASEAHRWLTAGTYVAAGADGAGPLHLIVGAASRTGEPAASAAFTSSAYDATVLHHISALLQQATPQTTASVLHDIGDLIALTGRPGLDLEDPSAVEASLRDLLQRRGRDVDDEDPEGHPAAPLGPDRSL